MDRLSASSITSDVDERIYIDRNRWFWKVDVVSDCRRLGAVLEVLGVVRGVVAYILRCSTAQEGMLETRVIGGVEGYEILVDSFPFDEI